MEELLHMSVQGTVLILLILLLRRIFSESIPTSLQQLLWCGAYVRLLLPDVVLRTGGVIPKLKRAMGLTFAAHLTDENIIYSAVSRSAITGSLQGVIYCIWAAGAVLAFGWILCRHIRGMSIYQMALPVQDERLQCWLEAHPLRRRIRLAASDRILSPATCGILRPTIILPTIFPEFSEQEQAYVLLHEWTHIRRFDTLRKWFAVLTACVHWFNPLVWVMVRAYGRDLECCCDEQVVRSLGAEHRKSYAETLFHAEKIKNQILLGCAFAGRSSTEKRIVRILNIGKAQKGRRILTAAALLAVLLLLTVSVQAVGVSRTDYERFMSALQYGRVVCCREELDFDTYETLGEDEEAYISLLAEEEAQGRVQQMVIGEAVTGIGSEAQ